MTPKDRPSQLSQKGERPSSSRRPAQTFLPVSGDVGSSALTATQHHPSSLYLRRCTCTDRGVRAHNSQSAVRRYLCLCAHLSVSASDSQQLCYVWKINKVLKCHTHSSSLTAFLSEKVESLHYRQQFTADLCGGDARRPFYKIKKRLCFHIHWIAHWTSAACFTLQ